MDHSRILSTPGLLELHSLTPSCPFSQVSQGCWYDLFLVCCELSVWLCTEEADTPNTLPSTVSLWDWKILIIYRKERYIQGSQDYMDISEHPTLTHFPGALHHCEIFWICFCFLCQIHLTFKRTFFLSYCHKRAESGLVHAVAFSTAEQIAVYLLSCANRVVCTTSLQLTWGNST